jgi:hypothetical protein
MRGSPRLRHVDLYSLPAVAAYAEAFAECGLKHLETFRASNCPGFRGHDVAVLNQSCPGIGKIYLWDIDYRWTPKELVRLLQEAKEQGDLLSKLIFSTG